MRTAVLRLAWPLLLLLFVAVTPSTWGGEVRLESTWRGQEAAPPTGVLAKVYKIPPFGPWESYLERPLVPGQLLVIEVPAGRWAVTADGREAWSRYERFTVGQDHPSVALEVWPAGEVRGKVVVPAGVATPSELKVRFSPAPGALGPPSGLETCRVREGGDFRCRLPATRLDLRLRAEEWLSHYRWGLEVARGREVDLGTLKLEPGASVVGWVAIEGSAADLSKVEVTLEPAGLASPLASETKPQNQLMRQHATANDRGFFYFNGVEPGAYGVTARLEPYGPATEQVQVLESREAEIRAPLLLAPAEVLTVQIEPPQDPYGDGWRAVLVRTDEGSRRGERVGEKRLELDGFLRWEGLPRGQYLLSILGFDSRPWALARVELGVEPMPLTLELVPLQIKGRVKLGDQPIEAEIWFGGRYGGVQAHFVSDEHGQFEGILPRPGEWKVEIESKADDLLVSLGKVSVRPREGQSIAEVTLELPNTKVKLKVLDEQGRPTRGRVNVSSGDLELAPDLLQKEVDDRGTAEIRGLAPGTYFFLAKASDGRESRVQEVRLLEDLEPPAVELRLRRLRRLEVKVVSGGAPVPGARVFIYPLDAPYGESGIELTEPSGVALVPMPPEARQVQAMVFAPGLSFHLARYTLLEEGPLVMELRREVGTLRLRASIPKDQAKSVATLRHLGALLSWQSLGAINPEVTKSGVLFDQAVIPNAEPGLYSLCPGGEDVVPNANHPSCVSGALAPNGELELALE